MTIKSMTTIDDFLSNYPPDVQLLADHLRKLIIERLPTVQEQLDTKAKLIGYSFGSRYIDLICTLIPSKKGLKVGFYKGSTLPDPASLLTGSGKLHRYVIIHENLNMEALATLLDQAYEAYRNRMGK